MSQLSSKLRAVQTSNGTGVAFWCPGCEEEHDITTAGVAPWKWDGNVDAPTFNPSVLTTSGHYVSSHKQGDPCWCTYNRDHPERPSRFKCRRCHSYVRAGSIEFLRDCSHGLAGQTVPLPDLPAYLQSG